MAELDCDVCHGDRIITINPSPRRDPQMEQDAPCPACTDPVEVSR